MAKILSGYYQIHRWSDQLASVPQGPTRSWEPLVPHPVQIRFLDLWEDGARFLALSAGRRSGKTRRVKQLLAGEGLRVQPHDPFFIYLTAPVQTQANRIWWDDIVNLIPDRDRDFVNKTEREIRTRYGVHFVVVGLDRPERIEGRPIDIVAMDEVDESKPEAWTSTIRPGLSTPGRVPGRAIFLGRPKGHRILHNLYTDEKSGVEVLWWSARDLWHPDEVKDAERHLDPATVAQEIDAAFVTFDDRAYYRFDKEIHGIERLAYRANLPLDLAFDFNAAPGVCSISQEQGYRGRRGEMAFEFTSVFDEVWIERNGTIDVVMDEVIRRYSGHTGQIRLFGDATGGAKTSVAVSGSAWAIVNQMAQRAWPGRVERHYRKSNPAVIARLNAMNARLRAADGTVSLLIDPETCPQTMLDMELTQRKQGTYEIDKPTGTKRTHIADALGYKVAEQYPIGHWTATEIRSIR